MDCLPSCSINFTICYSNRTSSSLATCVSAALYRATRCDTVHFSGKKSPSVWPLMSCRATPLSRDAFDADLVPVHYSIAVPQSSEPTERSIRSKFKLVQLYDQLMTDLLWSSQQQRRGSTWIVVPLGAVTLESGGKTSQTYAHLCIGWHDRSWTISISNLSLLLTVTNNNFISPCRYIQWNCWYKIS